MVAGWVLLAVAGGLAAARSGGRLSFAFDLPGQPSYQTNTAIARTYGSGGNEPPLVAVVRLPRGTTVQSPEVREQLARVFGKAAAALPGARTASWVSTGDRAFVSADGRTTFELIYPVASFASSDPYATALPRLGKALAGQYVHGAPVRVTGATILSSGGQGGGNSVQVETLLAGLGALVVLAVVFGSLVAITPFKILSTGLAAGIIIDANLIRGILAPALVTLLGRLNWWLPAPAARLLRVTPLIPHHAIDRHHAASGSANP